MLNPEQIKKDSIAQLRVWDIPVSDHLPTLENESELSPQSATAVARRCIILIHIIVLGFGGDARELKEAVCNYGLLPYASDLEKDLLDRTSHTDQEKLDATWLIECMQSLAWCLGLAELDAFQHCDDELASCFPDPYTDPSSFVSSARLRPFEEIYRQADIHYRLHWAARNTQLGNKKFPVSEGFIRERRKALDWVIGVERNWDEVPSDT